MHLAGALPVSVQRHNGQRLQLVLASCLIKRFCSSCWLQVIPQLSSSVVGHSKDVKVLFVVQDLIRTPTFAQVILEQTHILLKVVSGSGNMWLFACTKEVVILGTLAT